MAIVDKSIPSAEIQYTEAATDGLDDGTELVTLQAHREAIEQWQSAYFQLSCDTAKKDAALKEQAMQYVSLFGQLQEALEEIAKKDAALKTCVEATQQLMEAVKTITVPGKYGRETIYYKELADAASAITQAQEAQR